MIREKKTDLTHSYGYTPKCCVLYALSRVAPYPIGFINFNFFMTNLIEIGYIEVMNSFRGQGAGNFLLNKLREDYSDMDLCTASISDLAKPLLVDKFGFKEERNGWFLRVP